MDLENMGGVIKKSDDNFHDLESVQMYHERFSDFSSYFGGRRNGWNPHLLIFDNSVNETYNSSPMFQYDTSTGSVSLLQDCEATFEIWWQGHAPYGYKFVRIYKNCDIENFDTTFDLVDSFEERWMSEKGHLSITVAAKKNDRFDFANWPAHIQGTPSVFTLSICINSIANETKSLSSDSSKFHAILQCIDSGEMGLALDGLKQLTDNELQCFIRPSKQDNGNTVAEKLSKLGKSDAELYQIRAMCCPVSVIHASYEECCNLDLTNTCYCGSFTSPQHLKDIEARKLLNYQADVSENDYGDALWRRGVTVEWLLEFTKVHDCFHWPTWRVVQYIIKPETYEFKCRYTELPNMSETGIVGETDIFLSHCWSGNWGTLVAAAVTKLDKKTRVWCDVFAVRQWPGSGCDLAFEEVVKRSKGVILVTTSIENASTLSYIDVEAKNGSMALDEESRKMVPFLRVWCLVEIHAAIVNRIPLIIMCGLSKDNGRRFVHNYSLLHVMQNMIDIEKAEATVQSDIPMVLGIIEKSVGFVVVNKRVRGAIVGALASNKCPEVSLAAIGYTTDFDKLMATKDPDTIRHIIIAAAGGGYDAQLSFILEVYPDAHKLTDNASKTPLMYASQGGHMHCIAKLLEAGADPNVICANRWTALMYGASVLDSEQLEIFQRHHANFSCGDFHPIFLAAQAGNYDMCSFLLSGANGAKVMSMRDGIGYTPLRQAITFNHIDIAKLFLQCGADINAKDNWDSSILSHAIQSPMTNFELIKFVVDCGAIVEDKDCETLEKLLSNSPKIEELRLLFHSKKIP